METIRVSGKMEANKVGGLIAGYIRDGVETEAQAIGAAAVNQAVKGIIIARGLLAQVGKTLTCVPSFTEVDVEGLTKTGIKFKLIAE